MATFSKQRIDRRLVLRARNRRSHKGLGNQVEKLQELRRKAKEPTILAGFVESIMGRIDRFNRRLAKYKAKAVR